jgi:hypothetical protein
MRKLALTLSAFGFIAFAGLAHADDKTNENTEKTESSKTLTGKRKITHEKKVTGADGTTTEMNSETTLPKQDDNAAADRSGSSSASEKTEQKTTLGGKRQLKTSKKVDNADGTSSESTRTTTEGANK